MRFFFNPFLLLLVFPHLNSQYMDTHTPWKLEGANERIEKYRKGTAKIEFYKEGKKINTNGVINLKLINHEFKFGVSMTQSRGLMQRGESFESPDFIFYKEKVKEIFNFITIGMYWYALDDTRINFEKDMRNYISHVIEWGLKNDLEIKGHPLLWHESNPKWVENNKNPKKLEKEIYRRIKSLIEDYPEIKYWDVYNEAVAAFKNHVKPNGVSRWIEYNGGTEKTIVDLYSFVNDVNPEKIYTNNHYNPNDPDFFDLNKFMIDNNVKFDAIGMQAHMQTRSSTLSENELWNLMESFKPLGKKIQFTELSVTSSVKFNDWKDHQEFLKKRSEARKIGKEMNLPSLKKLENYQSAYISDFYTLVFSHPSVTSLTYWNLFDKNAWRGHASGLVDSQNNEKKAFYTLKKLIKEKWNTNISETKIDLRNPFKFKGFYGTYSGKLKIYNKIYDFTFMHKKNSSEIIKINL